MICRCEQVTRGDIERALEQGVQDIAGLKMRTRAGMGDCQGRMCIGYCSDRLRRATGRHDVGWLRPRFRSIRSRFPHSRTSVRKPEHEQNL